MRANHLDDLRLGETGEGWRTEVRLDAGTNLRTIIPAIEADETAGLDSVGNTIGTASALAIGASTNGFVNAAGDQDWYAVTMVAGESYSFSLTGSTLQDPYIELYDASGALIGFDDDFGPGINSLLRWTATTSGTYYINAQAFPASGGTGSYTLTAQTSAAASPLDAIDYHYMMPTTNIAVWFSTPGYTNPTGDATLRSWTTGEINAVMAALATYSAIAPLTFSVAASQATATWTFTLANLTGNTLGYFAVGSQYAAFDPTVSNFTAGLTPGGNSWTTIIHEAGHGLGMAHPHDNGAANYGANNSEVMQGVTDAFNSVGTFLLNQGVFTTMSYNDGWYSGFGVPPSNLVGNQATPMALDIALIQQVYGINSTTGLGNSTYTLAPTNSAYRSIWDNGGTDTISYTGASSATIDLRAATLLNAVGGGGYVSFVQGVHGGWTIANGVVIENATGGNGNDTLIGNSADNVLDGGAGVDTMQGGDGNDTYAVSTLLDVVVETPSGGGADTVHSSANNYQLTANVENLTLLGTTLNGGGNALNNIVIGNAQNNLIWGGDGNDTLDPGAGVDVMDGGNGDDIYYVDAAGETTYESSALGGTDTVYASVEVSLAANIENLILLGAAINGGGNGLHNTITGNANSNLIWGLEGNDWLDGAGGADQMDGGNGDDTYVVDNASDVTWEGSALGGIDTVRASLSWILGTNLEYLTLLTGASYGGGNSLNNVIIGTSADNLIWGADGDDILDGGLGADAMDGGNGNDFYIVDNNNDFVYEASALGGADTVVSSDSYILGANVEVLSITGSAYYAGGNSANNYIVGNAGANLLWGADGNDTLDGGTGADAMDGGNGDDTYIVDNSGDVTYEASALGGIDTVESSVNRTLAANLENLKLTGSAAINGAGNSSNNIITGNGAANVLTGGAGDDSFVFNTALGPSNVDTIADFNVANDTIHLSTAIFTGIGGTGVLSAAAFHIGAAAADASDRIIYDSATGALYYDADGNGGGAAIQFATLATGLALTNDDFLGFGP